MPAILNAQCSANTSGGGAYSVTIPAYLPSPGDARVLIATAEGYDSNFGTVVPTAPLKGGVAFAPFDSRIVGTGGGPGGGEAFGCSIWFLINPSDIPENVVATWPGLHGGNNGAVLKVFTVIGADVLTPLDPAAFASGNSTTPSVAVASLIGQLIIDSTYMIAPAGILPCASQTPVSSCGVPFAFGVTSFQPGDGVKTHCYTTTLPGFWGVLAAPLRSPTSIVRRPVEYTYDIWEANPQVRDAAGRIVPPQQVRANRWIRILGAGQPTSERPLSFVDDSEIAYIESVRYNGDTATLTISTSRSELGEVIVARAAGKSTA